jgi:hypothetical protein
MAYVVESAQSQKQEHLFMPRKRAGATHPMQASFRVIERGGVKRLLLLWETDAQGKVRSGRQVCGSSKVTFIRLSAELFKAADKKITPVAIYELSIAGTSMVRVRQLSVSAGGRGSVCCVYCGGKGHQFLEASWFSNEQIVYVTGYEHTLDRDLLNTPSLANR